MPYDGQVSRCGEKVFGKTLDLTIPHFFFEKVATMVHGHQRPQPSTILILLC
jgi:hypothetical protein